MPLILNIETATTVCSASLSDLDQVIDVMEQDGGYTHAENLHVFVEDLIARNGAGYADLSAVAVSRGPGSYTGLRIGVSAAKGFCFALGIPLISVDTLGVIAAAAGIHEHGLTLCPMIDARRMEVYMACYDTAIRRVSEVEAFVVSEGSIERFRKLGRVAFMGNGMNKCRDLLGTLSEAVFIDGVKPSARSMARFSADAFLNKRFEDVAYYEPYYLKEFVSAVDLKRKQS